MRTKTRLTALARLGLDFTDWYDRAHGELQLVARLENWPIDHLAGTISVLSPQVSVTRNIRNALQFMHSGLVFDNTMAPMRASLDHFVGTGKIRGQKTSSFYRALLGDTEAVVLDVWIAKALEIEQKTFKRVGVRKEAASRIRSTAKILDLTPAAAQACIWAGIIREHGRYAPQFPVLVEYRNFLLHRRQFPQTGSIESL